MTISSRKIACCIVNLALLSWNSALVADIAYACLGQAYASRPNISQRAESKHVEVRPSKRHPFAYYRVIVKRDIFKTQKSEKAALDRSAATEQLQVAQLDARLWGTATGSDGSRFAVIETTDSSHRVQQHLFREGDAVNSAVIQKILRDKVVVSVNGQRQLLVLEDYKSQPQRRRLPRRARSSRRISRRIIPRATIERAVGNVGQLMTQARIVPRETGLQITSIKPGSLFRRLGLRNGDVIQGVNGRSIRSVDDALSIYRRLLSSNSVAVDIQRRGRRWTMKYSIR